MDPARLPACRPTRAFYDGHGRVISIGLPEGQRYGSVWSRLSCSSAAVLRCCSGEKCPRFFTCDNFSITSQEAATPVKFSDIRKQIFFRISLKSESQKYLREVLRKISKHSPSCRSFSEGISALGIECAQR